jgi:hypothetical protein
MYCVYHGAKGRTNDSDMFYHVGVKYALLYTYKACRFLSQRQYVEEFEGTRSTSEVIQ